MELGFTQELLAANVQHLGDFEKWTAATVAAIETGRRNISLDELGTLCGALGVALVDLAGEEWYVQPSNLRYLLTAPVAPMTMGEEDLQRSIRRNQLYRLEHRVFDEVVSSLYAEDAPYICDASDYHRDRIIETLIQALREHYGHDLLEERDRRVNATGENKTWVSRRLIKEIAELPVVQSLNEFIADNMDEMFDEWETGPGSTDEGDWFEFLGDSGDVMDRWTFTHKGEKVWTFLRRSEKS